MEKGVFTVAVMLILFASLTSYYFSSQTGYLTYGSSSLGEKTAPRENIRDYDSSGFSIYQEQCKNGIDDDFDGNIDCQDKDCKGKQGPCGICEYPIELTCNDLCDNDGNGPEDCSDPQCVGTPACTVATGEFTLLYGMHGEGTNQQLNRMADFSWAGRDFGELALPSVPIIIDVTASPYNAVGNGIADDTNAIKAAITAAKSAGGGGVHFPVGTYRITDVITIDGDGIYLIGDGIGQTIIFIDTDFKTLTGSNNHYKHCRGGIIQLGKDQLPNQVNSKGSLAGTVVQASSKKDTTLTLAPGHTITPGNTFLLEMTDATGPPYGLATLAYETTTTTASPGSPACSAWWPLPYYWFFTVTSVNGNVIAVEPPLPLDTPLAFAPKVYHPDAVTNVGIEDMTITFPDDIKYKGHQNEDAANGIGVWSAYNYHLKNIEVLEADNDICMEQAAYGTFKNIILGDRMLPDNSGFDKHYGLAFRYNSHNNLLTDVKSRGKAHHTISVTGYAHHNVIDGVNKFNNLIDDEFISFDHHGAGPHDNLYQNSFIGPNANQIWASGGDCGDPSGAGDTYYNIVTNAGEPVPPPQMPTWLLLPWDFIRTNHMPVKLPAAQSPKQTTYKHWQEELVVEPYFSPFDNGGLYGDMLLQRVGYYSPQL
jgi:hypothetical protein